jgi:hypothetical protein
MSNPQLQDFVLTAYGLQSESGYTSLMTKVLSSNTSDSTSFAASLANSQFLQIAKDFNYGGSGTAATPSSASVAIGGLSPGGNFSTFSGTFARRIWPRPCKRPSGAPTATRPLSRSPRTATR